MTGSQVRSENVRRYILERVEQSPESVAAAVREKFGISRQAVNRHLQRLCQEGILERSGHTRARRYRLVTLSSWSKAFLLEPALAEDVVWSQDVSEVLSGLERNASEIWHYGFTEIFNNAIDHSEGSVIHVSVSRTALAGDISIADNGCGIFKKITRGLELVDERARGAGVVEGQVHDRSAKAYRGGHFFRVEDVRSIPYRVGRGVFFECGRRG